MDTHSTDRLALLTRTGSPRRDRLCNRLASHIRHKGQCTAIVVLRRLLRGEDPGFLSCWTSLEIGTPGKRPDVCMSG